MQLGSMFICNCNILQFLSAPEDGRKKRPKWCKCNIAVTNKHTAKLHHVGSFIYINLWCTETQT